MGKRYHERGTQVAASPSPSAAPTPFWRIVALPTLGAMALVASLWAYTRPTEKPVSNERRPETVVREALEPTTADDRLVVAFLKARNADVKSTLNLAPAPVFDGKPVSEAEGEAMQASYFLHRARKIVAIHVGEPGKGEAWLNTPNHYTLTTRASGTTPKVAVKVGDRVDTPSELSMLNPDIVVEVRNGKIHALRAELHRE